MTDDIRIKFTFINHLKTKRLIRECGYEGLYSLISLWIYVAQNNSKGILKGFTASDIEDAANWGGEKGKFFDFCLNIFIDEINGGYKMHDWKDHQGFIYYSDERSKQARLAGIKSGEVRSTDRSTGSSTDRSTDRSTEKGNQLNETGTPSPLLSFPSPSSPDLTLPKSKSSDKSKLNPCYSEFVKQIFPDVNGKSVEAQAQVLDKIIRIDKADFGQLKIILKWAVNDDFWGKNFQSCAGLRKRKHGVGDRMKWEKIKAAYEKSKPQERYYDPGN